MAFAQTVAQVLPGFGTPTITASVLNTNTNANVVLPASATNFAFPVTKGYIRIKALTMGSSGTLKVLAITGWDATNSLNIWQIYSGDLAATGAGQPLDQVYMFCTDVGFSRINVNVLAGTAVSQYDVEIAANP